MCLLCYAFLIGVHMRCVSFTTMDVTLKHPFTCMVAGPTMCGKTEFVKQLLKGNFINQPIDEIVWCYGVWQPGYADLNDRVKFVEGLLDPDILNPNQSHLIVIDDLMNQTDERVTKFFTQGCHHRNTSVIYIVQNLFHQGKQHRTISLNCQYMVLFKNPRDSGQINHLACQMYPKQSKVLHEAFDAATHAPYGYLFLDLKPHTPHHLRLRGRILDSTQDVYMTSREAQQVGGGWLGAAAAVAEPIFNDMLKPDYWRSVFQ